MGAYVSDYDVIVLGGGPAGSAAAATAARQGLRTALVDHKRFPRDKLCGGLFTGRALRHFRDAFDGAPAVDFIERRDNFAFYMGGQSLGSLKGVPPVYLSMRRSLDHDMMQRAIAQGAVDMTGQCVGAIDYVANTLSLRTGETLSFRALIGADGVNSMVARGLFGQSFDRSRVGFGLEVEAAPDPCAQTHAVRIDLGAAHWGYGWSFPKSESTTIGVGGILSRNDDMKAAMTRYLHNLGHDTTAASVKGQFLPFGDFRTRPGRENVLLAGDAAGLVDPITGEGIAYALRSGQLAGLACYDALRLRREDQALRFYKRRLRPIHASLRTARMLRPLMYHPFCQPAFASAFRHSQSLRRRYMDLLAGEAEYGAILRGCFLRTPMLARLMWRNARIG